MAAEANYITLIEAQQLAKCWRGTRGEYAGAKKLTRVQCKNRLHEAIQLARYNGFSLEEIFRELNVECEREIAF